MHDENAYALGGVAGHAGLFSTAADLSIFAQMILERRRVQRHPHRERLDDEAVHHRAAGSRALGWAMADGQWGSGRFLSDEAFGHVGYTGTSLWIDPDRDMFVILLTNRVHEPRARRPEKVIADIRADLSDAAAIAVTDDPDQPIAMPASFRADRASGWNHIERRHHRRVRHRGTKSTVRIAKRHSVTSSHSKKAVVTAKKSHTARSK